MSCIYILSTLDVIVYIHKYTYTLDINVYILYNFSLSINSMWMKKEKILNTNFSFYRE